MQIMGEAKRRGTREQRAAMAIQSYASATQPAVITKLEVATVQLDAAIRLFFGGDYVSSLTLAGAAEGILGALSQRAELPNAVDFVVDYYRGETDTETDREHRKFITDILNEARNQAKHAGDPSETHFEVERIQPVSMIMRALPMVEPLGGEFSDAMKAFAVWLKRHPEL
ncbi:hypothetical protein AYM40_09790 [Paraburkholderia phytofirmans OLGA172]|uniref:Uncharacterized protein n=1 Tax=Paraburkholderia phytofirmans OLGA172 TaxID=1417228 RepID=A0A160FKN9_9BURK|nr:hypothetical protein [Paraburkholderia phytofirmans]ANB72626.1 hypothetical protein AYM40_09790 [Paraburkholderia phytofirmans OLGA172]